MRNWLLVSSVRNRRKRSGGRSVLDDVTPRDGLAGLVIAPPEGPPAPLRRRLRSLRGLRRHRRADRRLGRVGPVGGPGPRDRRLGTVAGRAGLARLGRPVRGLSPRAGGRATTPSPPAGCARGPQAGPKSARR